VRITAINRLNQEVARWDLFNAWPKKIRMDVKDRDQMVEELILVSEGFVRDEVSVPDVCVEDSDGDGDADGKDLAKLIGDFKSDCLAPFAAVFGDVAVK
jgi:hypothetical protein